MPGPDKQSLVSQEAVFPDFFDSMPAKSTLWGWARGYPADLVGAKLLSLVWFLWPLKEIGCLGFSFAAARTEHSRAFSSVG